MAGPSWLVDGNRFATKIKSASDPERAVWKSNPKKCCPNCDHIIDNSDVVQDWPGLPRGVKFDPTDEELILHLLAKSGSEDIKPHPFIDEFIPTLTEKDGICYTHPRNLPGVKQDGSVSHFFHRAIKAYNTGTRKRRKIQGDDLGDVRWHKTGRTKPVVVDGVQKGCKKIMVLYASLFRGVKAVKTNWVMHQYHLGVEEEEKEGDYVISKIFYQQQQQTSKKDDKIEDELDELLANVDTESFLSDNVDPMIAKVDPVTPMSVTPIPPRNEKRAQAFDVAIINNAIEELGPQNINHTDNEGQEEQEIFDNHEEPKQEHDGDNMDDDDNINLDDYPKWSQDLLDSQQLVEGLSLCDELFRSQSPGRDENGNEIMNGRPRLSDYAKLGPEHLKKDLEECQNLVFDPANLDLDTPPDFRLSQLEFGSQDSYLAFGVPKSTD